MNNKIILTQPVEEAEKQWIINRSIKPSSPLIKGRFLSSKVNHGFSINGGDINELINTTIVSVVPATLIITILLQGKLNFGYDDLTFNLNASDQALGVVVNLTKPANFRRNITQNNHVKKLHLMFTPEWIQSRLNHHCNMTDFILQHKRHASFNITPSIYQMTQKIMSSHLPDSLTESIKYEALSYQLLSEVIDGLTSEPSNLKDTNKPLINKINTSVFKNLNQKENKTIENMLNYIESHLDQVLSLKKIAEKFSMSSSNLQRIFKQRLGLTVNSYIRNRRLEIAKYHLEQGLMSVTEAAYEAGYHHPANFTHAFKKAFGQPPTVFVK